MLKIDGERPLAVKKVRFFQQNARKKISKKKFPKNFFFFLEKKNFKKKGGLDIFQGRTGLDWKTVLDKGVLDNCPN